MKQIIFMTNFFGILKRFSIEFSFIRDLCLIRKLINRMTEHSCVYRVRKKPFFPRRQINAFSCLILSKKRQRVAFLFFHFVDFLQQGLSTPSIILPFGEIGFFSTPVAALARSKLKNEKHPRKVVHRCSCVCQVFGEEE